MVKIGLLEWNLHFRSNQLILLVVISSPPKLLDSIKTHAIFYSTRKSLTDLGPITMIFPLNGCVETASHHVPERVTLAQMILVVEVVWPRIMWGVR